MSLPCIILGGGPAGAACAIELARKGRRVVVLERTRTAQHKVCGDFVSAEASTLAAYLGVDLWALGATEINSFSLASRTEVVGTRLPFAAAALSRLQLDEALLQAASDAGADHLRLRAGSAERSGQLPPCRDVAGIEGLGHPTGGGLHAGRSASVASM